MIVFYWAQSIHTWALSSPWTSFLQGRMALLVTLFLVLVIIINAITTNSPKADGLNALQAWVIACIFFVFGKTDITNIFNVFINILVCIIFVFVI